MGRYGLYGPYLYDYHLNYPTHQCVILNRNQCECKAISVYVWQSEYVHEYVLAYLQSNFFFISLYYSNYSYCIFWWVNKSLMMSNVLSIIIL